MSTQWKRSAWYWTFTWIPAVALLACGHHSPNLLKDIREYLAKQSGTVVVRYAPEALYFHDPSCRGTNLGFFRGTAGCDVIRTAGAHGSKIALAYAIEAPTPLVQESFLSALKPHIDIQHVQVQSAWTAREDLKTSKPVIIIDFRVFDWKFHVWDPKADSKPPEEVELTFWFGAKSSIDRVDPEHTLWAETCFVRTNERGEGPYRYGDLLANGGAKVKELTRRAAETCGKELASKLVAMGK